MSEQLCLLSYYRGIGVDCVKGSHRRIEANPPRIIVMSKNASNNIKGNVLFIYVNTVI